MVDRERAKNLAMYENLKRIAEKYPNMEQHKKFTLNFGIRQAEMILGILDEELTKLKEQKGE
jgi:hypothetical protein